MSYQLGNYYVEEEREPDEISKIRKSIVYHPSLKVIGRHWVINDKLSIMQVIQRSKNVV